MPNRDINIIFLISLINLNLLNFSKLFQIYGLFILQI